MANVAAPPPLPTTFRPLWARRVIYPVAALIVVCLAVVAMVLPANYKLPDRAAITGMGLGIAWFLHRLAAVRVEADESGLTVVNLFRRRRLAWPEVVAVRLRRGDPWLTFDLADGYELPVMGVQGSDGDYARRQTRELATLVGAHSRTQRND